MSVCASSPPSLSLRFLHATGLPTLLSTPLDVKLLILTRFIRLFAFGSSTLILASYLSALGITDSWIGFFMTATAIGDSALGFIFTFIADAAGRRAILMVGAAGMVAAGLVFATLEGYWVLLGAAVMGVISASGSEMGPFRAIEESTLAHLVGPDERVDVYAWYGLIGKGGGALGLMTCGWLVKVAQEKWVTERMAAYRMVFYMYAALGLITGLVVWLMSRECEIEREAETDESEPLLNGERAQRKEKKQQWSLLPSISKKSKGVLVNLCLLLSLDSFASGLVPDTWVTYIFKTKFALSEGTLGSLFFAVSILAAMSILVSAAMAKRLGNIKTMVVTNLPSAFVLALIPLPSSLPLAVILLLTRAFTGSMDVAPRSAFLAAVVLPTERTAIIGATNIVKTASNSLGPLVTGLLGANDLFWLSFVIAGGVKVLYNLGLLVAFFNRDSERGNREEADTEQRMERRSSQGEGFE